MSATRDKARGILDAAIPGDKIITSTGPTAAKYTELTGIQHKTLADNWAGGGIMTGCNGFTGWYGTKMGSAAYLGGFDLEGIAKKAGKGSAWTVSRADNKPQYGDILRHASFHVDVALDFDGDVLLRAAGGQGGKSAGFDIVKRVRGKGPYDYKSLVGWIDIDKYFGETAAMSLPVPLWLQGWWEVKDGADTYYYYFDVAGDVQYTKNKAFTNISPNFPDDACGTFKVTPSRSIEITWNDPGYPVENLAQEGAATNKLKGTLANSQAQAPFSATKI